MSPESSGSDRPPVHTALHEGAEFDLVRRMLSRWDTGAEGIGDDAAVLSLAAGPALVVSTDVSVENIHFRTGWLKPREIGYRSTATALSDLAAMAAEPLGILVALTLSKRWSDRVEELADGIGEAARESSAKIVGGDLSEGKALSLAVTVFGRAVRPLRRSGARAGDRVYVTGTLGGAGAALQAFMSKRHPSDADRRRFAHPEPRIREALWLAKAGATSAIDISDGLSGDLSHIAAASGVGISIYLERLRVVDGVSPSEAAQSGEEYELAVTSSTPIDTETFEAEFGLPLTEIGSVEAGPPAVRVFDRGTLVPTPPGYLHFEP